MLEMLKARKEQLQAQGVKGFTLMEMLIVIAIIAVLIAIAIPIFTAQLDNARLQTDAANIRGGYATATATVVTDPPTSATSWYLHKDGTIGTDDTDAYETQGAGAIEIAGQDLTDATGMKVKYTFTPGTGTGAQNAVKIELVS